MLSTPPPPKPIFISHFIENDQTIFSLFPPTVNSYLDFCHFYKWHQCVYTKRLICIFWKGYICSPRTLNGSAVTIFSPVAIVNIHCFPSIIPIRHRNHIYCTAVIIETRRRLPLEAWCMRAQALSVNLFHKRVAEKHLIWLWNYTDEIDGPKIIENKCYVALVFA